MAKLRQAREDNSVRAVILQVNSPGGGLTASDQVYNEILKLKKAGKKLITSIGSSGASGAYYIAAPSDWIVASPTSLVGSIGVIMERFQISELMKTIGIKHDPIASGENKDFGSMFRDLRPEELQLLKDLVTHYHGRFKDIVSEGRSLTNNEIDDIADGRIFDADQAKKLKLVDEIGYFDEALDKACNLVGVSKHEVNIIAYKKELSFHDILMGLESRSSERWMESVKQLGLSTMSPSLRLHWTGGMSESKEEK